jgi:ubiquinone/menaquinone biosynthesis C-methylase UbiE
MMSLSEIAWRSLRSPHSLQSLPFRQAQSSTTTVCGTGAATAAIAELISSKVNISLKGTDINEKALDVYKSNMAKYNWPAEAVVMDSQKLSFPDNSFSHVIENAFLLVLPNDGIDAIKETYRTLKPGGTAVFNSWFYVPNVEPLQIASRSTRPAGTPQPRDGMAK